MTDLDSRLPNPPVPFVGRSRESAALRRAVERAPVTVVAGVCGIGKSALCADVLRSDRDRVRVVNVLASGAFWESLWSAVDEAGRADDDLARLVDRADACDAMLVVEDAHRADPGDLRNLLAAVVRYARRSRWIVASRSPVADVVELAAQHVHLGGLDVESLSTLAAAYAPSLSSERAHELAVAAGGSPWHLQHSLGLRSDARELVGPLPEGDRPYLDLLRRVELPLATRTLHATLGIEETAIDRWTRWSLIEWIDGGVRVREQVREALTLTPNPSCTGARARAGLQAIAATSEESGDDAALVVAFRIHSLLDATAAMRRLLDVHGDSLLEAGFAPELWRELIGRREAELAVWRLRVGFDVGSTAHDALSYPSDAEPRDELLWARVRATKGDLDGAIAAATRALEIAEARGDRSMVSRAAQTLVRVLSRRGRVGDALALLDRVRSDEPLASLEHDAVRGVALIADRRDDEVASMIGDLHARLAGAHSASIELRGTIAWLAGNTGRLDVAWAVIRDAVARLGPRAERRDVGRRTLLAAFQIAIDGGALPEAARFRERLGEVALEQSYVGECVRIATARLRLALGDLDGLEALLSTPADEWRVERFRRPVELRIAMLKGVPLETARGADVSAIGGLVETEHALHFGRPADRAVLEHEARENDLETEAIALRVRAELSIADGRTRAALDWAWKAVKRAQQAGWALMEAEARCVAADALAIAGESSELDVAARELAMLAERIGSPRFAADARFYAWLARPTRSRGELLALDTKAASTGARRARVLLGAGPRTAIDELVLATCGATRVRPLTDERPHAECWLVDARAGDVWLPRGRIELSADSIGARILRALVADGGQTSKEALVLAVWGPREYHPLKHDNRLKLAVRKLRTQLEDDASRPVRIVTTDDGYALGPGALAEEHAPGDPASFAGRLREAFQA